MDFTNVPQEIITQLEKELYLEDEQANVRVKRTSLGWIKIYIVTRCFERLSLEERENKIDDLLAPIDFNLGQYPVSGYQLLTPEEADEQGPESIQLPLPLWSDLLMAPEPDQVADLLDEEISPRPLVVTFYSFKGGVGRSTALGLVSGILARRNRRVVMVDLDLEAPGISILFKPDMDRSNSEQYGVVDYLHQRFLTPDQDIPSLENCIAGINLRSRGELFLVPAGEYDENYIHRLADLDRGTLQLFYKREVNPVSQLIEDIKAKINPDIILIDARPGFNDTSAIALFDLADTAILCFSPTDQSFEGLKWVVRGILKQRQYRGKPDLRFLLTPMPSVAPDQLQISIDRVENWIEENWGIPQGTTVSELYDKVYYNPSLITLSSLVNDVPDSLITAYLPIAEKIDASLPDITQKPIQPSLDRKAILNQLQFQAPRAQDIEASEIPNIFQKTEDFPNFLNQKTWLIRGAKGSGKSLLFRFFVEQPDEAKQLAESDVDLRDVCFIPGHGEQRLEGPILGSIDIRSYEHQVGENSWQNFWLNYALLQLCHAKPEFRSLPDFDKELGTLSAEQNPSHESIVSWLVQRAKSPQAASKAGDQLRAINRWLQEHHQRVWLLYDELDVGFGHAEADYNRRRQALNALLAWWLEDGSALGKIVPKIFLREDIWEQLNFTNKGHYTTAKTLPLRWDEADLWRLVLRQILKSSEAFRDWLGNQFGVTVERLNRIELEQLRKSLYPLWGERMGKGKKAYTYNWIRTRIEDSQENRFPRSLILLLEEAVKKEKEISTEYSAEVIVRPKALIDAFPYVSEQRVDEVRNEYPELAESLNQLAEERSPIDATRLGELWKLNNDQLTSRIRDMIDAGIFTKRTRPQDPPPGVYAVAELYLYGLKMVRKGQR
ncbi:AAA family ATPase [Phormidium pseudopriestleyi FRX01]|uniref:AAA family ATPase n=1 Tax=Phormidium pseudopriestleyi FRX01 TaxID=1759528 RepID=A0ABS3FMS3_9CYAN|nr:AAA family ATPase [Phormidium pseudopriestleyi FRX01]